MDISFPFLLCFLLLFFSVICKASSDSHFAFLHFFFLGMVSIPVSCTMSRTSVRGSSGTLSIMTGGLSAAWVSVFLVRPPCHSLLSGVSGSEGQLLTLNSREGTQLHQSTENWIKDLLSMAPPIRTRPSFPLSQSFPSGSFHKPLILLHQRADRLKTTITEN